MEGHTWLGQVESLVSIVTTIRIKISRSTFILSLLAEFPGHTDDLHACYLLADRNVHHTEKVAKLPATLHYLQRLMIAQCAT